MEEFEKWNSKLIDLYRGGNWKQILELESEVPPDVMMDIRKRYLWAWPQQEDLTHFSDIAKKHGLMQGYLSIGCGSGLLEWLIINSTGISVTGLEIDDSWWSSKYSPLSFIPLKFISKDKNIPQLDNIMEDSQNKELIQNTTEDEFPHHKDFGLIFCYFNNGSAFNNYVNAYAGNVIMIIGPVDGQYIYTEPLPLKPKFDHPECWSLCSQKLMTNTRNVIAVYCRNI